MNLSSSRAIFAVPMVSTLMGYGMAAGVAGVANLVLVPVWIRVFGVAEYGRYAVVWAIAVAVGAATAGWIRQAALRSAGGTSRLTDLPVWVLATTVLLSGAVTAALSLLVGALDGRGVAAAAALAAALVVAQLVATVLQREERAWIFAVSEVTKVTATILLTLAVSRTQVPGHVAMMWGLAAGNFLTLGFVLGRGSALGRGGKDVLGEWWRYGWPLGLWLSLAPVVLYADRVVLQVFAEPDIVGSFAALSDITVRGFAALAAPVVTAAHVWGMREVNRGRPDHARLVMHRLAWASSSLTVALVLTAVAMGTTLTDALGITGLPATCFPLMVLGGGLWQVALFVHKPLEFARATRRMLTLLVVAVIVEILVCLALVPTLGPVGSAIGLLSGVLAYIGGCQIAASAVKSGVQHA